MIRTGSPTAGTTINETCMIHQAAPMTTSELPSAYRGQRLQRRPTPTGPFGAGGDPRISVHYDASTSPAGGVCELCFTSLCRSSRSTIHGPDDVGSSYSAVLPVVWPGQLGGRLGLRRRPDRPTRTTLLLRRRHATADDVDLPYGPWNTDLPKGHLSQPE